MDEQVFTKVLLWLIYVGGAGGEFFFTLSQEDRRNGGLRAGSMKGHGTAILWVVK